MADTRIQLQPLSGALYAEREVYVGWDQALQTFYARVTNGVDEAGAERVRFAVGTSPGEFTEPAAVVDAAAKYAQIPDGLAELLTIGRVSTIDTVTDLRPESRLYQHEQYVADTMSRLYRPGGFATTLTHEQIIPVLAEHGWALTDVSAARGGNVETYQRNGHDLMIPWGWPDRHHDSEQLLSPVTLDGDRYGVGSPQQLATVLAGARGTDDPAEHENLRALLGDLPDIGTLDYTLERHNTEALGQGVDDPLYEEPPDDDFRFGTGLGY